MYIFAHNLKIIKNIIVVLNNIYNFVILINTIVKPNTHTMDERNDYSSIPEQNEIPITRLEVINHAKNEYPIGRMLTLYQELGDFKSIELSYQDGKRTLKIFLN